MQGIDPQSLEDKFLSPNEAKEISSYANHINTYLCEDPYLKNYLPMDPTGNQLFDLIRDGVLLCKLINLAVPGTIDEGYINKKTRLNLWERYEKHTLCLKYAEAIGCTVVNIRAHDLIEGRPHLVLGLLSQIIKIHRTKTQQHEKMDIDKSDSCEKMTNGDSPKVVCSSDDMTEDGNLPEDSGDEDMGGDADSDDIYLEGFRSPDETESEDDEEESVDYLKKLAYYEFEAYNHNQSLEALDKKAGGAEEKRPEEKHTTREIVDVLDDRYELQVECGLLTRWALLNYSSLDYESSRSFLIKLRDTCLSLGMAKFSLLPIREFREIVDPVALEKLLDALKIELVLLIPPFLGYNDEKTIVEMCEKLGIAYQSCGIAYHICYLFQGKGPMKSLARQIQYKVVKRLVRLHRLELPLVREAPTIIFGADMVRGEGFDSIASVVASVDWPKFRRYLCVASYQEYNKGSIKDLDASPDSMMTCFFDSFRKKNKEWPKRLIFFRNGLEKGEFSHIYQQEISAIKQACLSFKGSLTYVVVMLHLHECLRASIMCKYKYFCRHTTKEISSVACYFVVHDENNFPAGELQALTSQLSTFRHRQKNPRVDVVIPAYLAFQHAVDELRDDD